MSTSYSMLIEAIFLLKEMKSQQSNAGDRVIKVIDQVILSLKALRGERFSEPEMMTLILQELGVLFSEFPEFQS